jgi:predicted acetyltransferase
MIVIHATASDLDHRRRCVVAAIVEAMDLALHSPAVEWAPSFLAGLDELDVASERAAWIYAREAGELPRRDFAAYVQLLAARALSPPPGIVPDSLYWAIRENEMVGRISFRHTLNDELLREGGHIGFIVRPSARRQGVAREMLRQLLSSERARAIGQLLVTCDEGNIASERTIRANGGILANIIDNDKGPRTMRFWIAVRQ